MSICFICKTTHNKNNINFCNNIIKLLVNNFKNYNKELNLIILNKYKELIESKIQYKIIQNRIENEIIQNEIIQNRIENEKIKNEIIQNRIIQNEIIQNEIIKNKIIQDKKIKNKCKFCNKILSSNINYKHHIKNKICQRNREYKCKDCGKIFAEKKNLEYHEYKFVCNKKKLNNNKIFKKNSDFIQDEIVDNIIINDSIQDEIVDNIIINDSIQVEKLETLPINILDNDTKKFKKKSIPITLKKLVWNNYIGEEIGKAKCLCCKLTDITQLSFNCGHIIPESKGGELKPNNLKPICQSCNSSMGTMNMHDYIHQFGF
jgi:hypothetical protein